MKILLIGLGRIGKLVARKMIAQDENKLDWVGAVEQTRDPELFLAICSTMTRPMVLWLQKSDTADSFVVSGQSDIPLFADVSLAISETNPDLVIDCSGSHRLPRYSVDSEYETVQTSPIRTGTRYIETKERYGGLGLWVNDADFDDKAPRNIINPGCLNNCLIPLIASLTEKIEIIKGTFVSVHSVTNTQPSLDRAQRSPRWSRASGSNLIPSPHDSMGLINKFFPT